MDLSTRDGLIEHVKDIIAQPNAPVDRWVDYAHHNLRNVRHNRYQLNTQRVRMAANSGNIALPADYLELKSLTQDGEFLRRTSVYNKGKCLSPSYFFDEASSLTVTPISDEGETLYLTYYSKIPALTESNPSNWLLREFPMAYVHATLVHAYQWLRDEAGENASRNRMAEAIAMIRADDSAGQRGGNTPVWR